MNECFYFKVISVCVTILKVENKNEDDFSMSISSMNSNVANDIYGVKEATGKKKPTAEASVQPREEAPTLTPSASDTVTLSTKDDASATTTSADGSTPPAKAPFPVVPVAIGGGVGALVGGLGGHVLFGDEPKEGGKVDLDGDNFKVKDKVKADGKKGVTDEATGLYYEIKEADTNAKLGDITGTPEISNTKYTYVKGDKPSLTHEFHVANNDLVLGADAAKKAKLHVSESGIKVATHTDVKFPLASLEYTLNDTGELVRSKAITDLIADTAHPTIDDTVFKNLENHLKTLQLGNVVKELKDKYKPKALTDLVHTEGGGGKNPWVIAGAALGVGALGAAAGWFFGRKKPEPTPDAPPVG